ncbi:hypothetical protein [Derxia gummosa]|uniref:TMhelix containing protein n=1 Tax=Derxia gummosa DSM 723 TaxID=1121388 RepID=A0A8B6X605_9BURK|nr:hypothetical protein [Derxia gummosa]
MANLLTQIFSAGATSLVDAVGKAVDRNFTTDDEKLARQNEIARADMEFRAEMARLSVEERKAVYGDIASARENQSRVQESANASWLAKNVHPVLALLIVAVTFLMFGLIIFANSDTLGGERKEVIIYVLGALTTISTQVVSYFFGSSSGSADKTRTIDSLLKRDA